MNEKDMLDFLAEAGMLKRIKRSGWWMAGIPYEESVAEHSYRCGVIGYALARMEKVEPHKVFLMTLFGDLPEARINDLHKVANRYLNVREAEATVYGEQIAPLSEDMQGELKGAREEYEKQETPESIVARDADILECLLQAKEYSDLGFKTAEKFFKIAPGHLRTESAKRLWEGMRSWDSSTWWEKFTEFER